MHEFVFHQDCRKSGAIKCCDYQTCKLNPSVQCADGLCCEDCKVRDSVVGNMFKVSDFESSIEFIL